MKNKVTVSRAPRLIKGSFRHLNVGDYYIADIFDSSLDEYGIFEKGKESICPHFTLPYKVALETDEVIPFDSFDDMCKWVANGKRLEDLCSHVQDLVDIEHMELGSYATVIGLDRDEDYEGETVFAHPHPRGYTLVETSCECSFPLRTKVWPLRAGDTITIEITE